MSFLNTFLYYFYQKSGFPKRNKRPLMGNIVKMSVKVSIFFLIFPIFTAGVNFRIFELHFWRLCFNPDEKTMIRKWLEWEIVAFLLINLIIFLRKKQMGKNDPAENGKIFFIILNVFLFKLGGIIDERSKLKILK